MFNQISEHIEKKNCRDRSYSVLSKALNCPYHCYRRISLWYFLRGGVPITSLRETNSQMETEIDSFKGAANVDPKNKGPTVDLCK
jgi:hypothetical protein